MAQADNSITVISTSAEEQNKTLGIVTKIPVIHHKIKRRILLFGYINITFIWYELSLSLSTACSTFTGPALAPALGVIALDLKDHENMSWVRSTNNPIDIIYLTFNKIVLDFIFIKLRISDCLGRRRVYLFGIVFMLISSLVAGLAVNYYMFIALRVFQGICGGILMTYWEAYFLFNVFMTIPPSLIIYFYLQIPVKLEQRLSMANFNSFFSRVDAVGCCIVSAGIACFLLGMNFGSTSLKYDWSSPIVIVLLVGSFSIASVPLFPSAIITNKNMVLIYTLQLINGFYYIPLTMGATVEFQAVYNDTPTKSSIKLIAPTAAFILFTLVQAKITKKLRTPKPALVVGNLIILLTLLLLIFVQTESSNTGIQIGFLVLYGAGFGFANQATTIGSQLILEETAPHMITASTALIRFLLQAGCAISTAIFFSTMNAQLKTNLELLHQKDLSLYQKVIESGSYRDYVKISSIQYKEVQTTLNSIYFKSISKTLYITLSVSAVAILCVIFVRIPQMPKKKSEEISSIDDQSIRNI
ncbi:MFS general substrate transporter [Backusella circina FSU 941]|nr:MFS general substrate transporter [Backusella circina FSU 941]